MKYPRASSCGWPCRADGVATGKSTILQALHYVREVLERQNPDPDHTIAGGLIDLGGFSNLIHNHELSRTMKIRLVVDLRGDQGSERLPINSGGSITSPEFEHLPLHYIVGENTDLKAYSVVESVGIALEIQWSDLLGGSYVAAISTEMDGKEIATIKSPPQEGRAYLTGFDFSHPMLQKFVDADEEPDEIEDTDETEDAD